MPEGEPKIEGEFEKLMAEFKAAQAEVTRVWELMDAEIEANPENRIEAEMIILDKYAGQYEAALEKESDAWYALKSKFKVEVEEYEARI